MKFRPEAGIFPMMSEEELKALAADIDEFGQVHTVKLYDGDILDGRNRWQAMTIFGRKHKDPACETVNPKSLISYVISTNEKRRHLNTGQRNAAGAESIPFFEEEAKKRQREAGKIGGQIAGRGRKKDDRVKADLPEANGHQARDDAAAAVGASPRGVEQAKRVKEQGSKNLFEAVKRGEISTDRAERIVKSTSDKRKQDELLKATMESRQATRVKSLTGEVEWYTPKVYIEAAVKVMGSIDLDPASSDAAQAHVEADKFYSIDDDGLAQPWWGNVFLNPPYRMPLIKEFTQRMVEMYEDKSIKQGILLTNNATDTEWFHVALRASTAVCLTKGRISFIQVRDGDAEEKVNPTNGQAFFYFGNRERTFVNVFGQFGAIIRRYV